MSQSAQRLPCCRGNSHSQSQSSQHTCFHSPHWPTCSSFAAIKPADKIQSHAHPVARSSLHPCERFQHPFPDWYTGAPCLPCPWSHYQVLAPIPSLRLIPGSWPGLLLLLSACLTFRPILAPILSLCLILVTQPCLKSSTQTFKALNDLVTSYLPDFVMPGQTLISFKSLLAVLGTQVITKGDYDLQSEPRDCGALCLLRSERLHH